MDLPWPKKLAEVRISSGVLSDAEIAALHRGKGRFPDVARHCSNRVCALARVRSR